jgi:hypothetical protein
VAAEARAVAPFRDPLLARPEVVDEAEAHIVHRGPFRDGDGEGEVRDASLCVDRAVDRVDDHPELTASAERPDPELLGDEGEVDAERLEPPHDDVLGRRVDRSRIVASLTGAEHGLALDARRQVGEDALELLDAPAREREPVGHGSSGWKSRPETSFGKK